MSQQSFTYRIAKLIRWKLPGSLGEKSSNLYHQLINLNFKYELFKTNRTANDITYKSYNIFSDPPDVTLEELFSSFQDGDTLYDVGAHLGNHTIPTVLRHPSSQVIAFEPHPIVCDYLRTNIRANPEIIDNININCVGIGQTESIKTFHRESNDI